MIVTLTLKVGPGEFFCSVSNSFTCLLNYGEKKFFLSLVHKNEVEKKHSKANEITNY